MMAPIQQLISPAVVSLLVVVSVFVRRIDSRCEYDALSSLTNHTSERAQVKCGAHQTRSGRSGCRISGGYQASAGQYPSYVHVKIQSGYTEASCGGTIISEWLVISAAHCFSSGSFRAGSIELIAGSVNVNSGRRFYPKQLCLPAQHRYDPSNHDIAILIMRQPIQFDRFIQPACLPPFDIGSNYQAHAVGFGLTSKGFYGSTPSRLQTLPVQRTTSCAMSDSNVICFVSNNPRYRGDTCEGDSGGPVYTFINGRQTVVGVVSAGPEGCAAGLSRPGIYMNVFTMASIIQGMVRHCSQL